MLNTSLMCEVANLGSGSCSVTIEVAGPVEGTYYNIAPSTIRGLAGWVIDRCIISSHGIGGFVTYELSSFIDPIVGSTVERFPEMALRKSPPSIHVTPTGTDCSSPSCSGRCPVPHCDGLRHTQTPPLSWKHGPCHSSSDIRKAWRRRRAKSPR